MFSVLKSSIIAVIISTLVIPISLFGQTFEPELGVSAEANQTTTTGPGLAVITLTNPSSVSVITANNSCSFNFASNINLVQDTGLINFNQPADCFTIRNKQLTFQQQLVVTWAETSASVSVVKQPVASWNHLTATNPAPQSIPMIPVPGLVLLVAAAMLTFAPIKQRVRQTMARVSMTLTLSQLQVMRC